MIGGLEMFGQWKPLLIEILQMDNVNITNVNYIAGVKLFVNLCLV